MTKGGEDIELQSHDEERERLLRQDALMHDMSDIMIDDVDDTEGLGIESLEYFRWSLGLWFLSVLLMVVTCGFILLLFRWMPILALKCRYRRVARSRATHVLVSCTDGTKTIVEIESRSAEGFEDQLPRMFVFRHFMYFETSNGFSPITYKSGQPFSALVKHSSVGLTGREVAKRRALFGNNLAEVPIKSHFQLLLDEILHPFYVFQIWSIVVWYLEPYVLYATAIAIISIFSALISLFSTRKNLINIRNMAQFSCDVTVLRRKSPSTAPERSLISSAELVPGDVIEITDEMTFPCDIVLCSGSSVVNESMLTGESLPVLKAAIPVHSENTFDSEADKRFVLFCGTKSLEARPVGNKKVTGIVLRTGFHTAKGRLVRSILFPKPASFKLYADSFKFVAVMSLMAVTGFLWSLSTFIQYDVDIRDVILNACDIVTIAVPPALPAAMTIGTEFALERLKEARIFCISPNRVNVCGQLDIICFDKTGTLTEEGVDVKGVLSIDGEMDDDVKEVTDSPHRLLQCLACCHGLTAIDGKLIGDPLDLKMFDATGWELHEPPVEMRHDSVVPPVVRPRRAPGQDHGESPESAGADSVGGLAIIRRFDFTSERQRMSVVARSDHEKGSHVFMKGAPEVVKDLCDPSTVPEDFMKVVHSYSKEGYRLLACAHYYDPSMTWHQALKIPRDKAENGLKIIGILVLENRLKPETAGVIAELRRADISTCMVTGDHALTGIAVSRHCGLINKDKRVVVSEVGRPPAPSKPSRAHSYGDLSQHAHHRSTLMVRSSSVAELGEESAMHPRADRSPVHSHLSELAVSGGLEVLAVHESPASMETSPTAQASRGHVHASHKGSKGHDENMLRWGFTDEEEEEVEEEEEETVWFRQIQEDGEEEEKHHHDIDHPHGEFFTLDFFLEQMRGEQHSDATQAPKRFSVDDLEFAITGPAFAILYQMHLQGNSDALRAITSKARVFARMSPDQKQALVETFAEMHGRVVGMCGDGANDCGALKAAHVGLSLSEAEASIAAPFTASEANIRPLVTLMREGRAALVTSISCFKFMALYSSIQFITVLRLYLLNTNMSDFQYLWIDLFLIFPLAVYMGRTGAYHRLSRRRPQGRLISFSVLSSVLGQTFIAGCYQCFAAWWTLQMKKFKCDNSCPGASQVCDPSDDEMPSCCLFLPLGCPTRPISSDTDDNILSVEATSAFLFSQFQYLAVVIAFNTSKPYRKSMVTNVWFFVSFLLLAVLCSLLLLLPDKLLQVLNEEIGTLELQPFPAKSFKWKMFALAVLNAAITYIFEIVVELMEKKREKKELSTAILSLMTCVLLVLLVFFSLSPFVLFASLRYT